MTFFKDLFSKLETLIVDRRLIMYMGTFLAALLAMPELLEYSTTLETQVIDLISAVTVVVEMVVGLVALLHSWGVRPPSGRKFKTDTVLVAEALERLLKPENK